MIEGLRPFYNRILKPFAGLFAKAGIHPNVITVLGVAVYGAVCWFLWHGQWRIGVAAGVLGALMDGLDGLVAREFGKKSIFGAILDSTCDRITEILIFSGIFGFYIQNPQAILAPALCIIALTGSLMVSYVKARAEAAGVACNRGILQRPERLIILGAFLLVGEKAMIWGLGIVSVLAYATVIQRLFIAYINSVKSAQRRA